MAALHGVVKNGVLAFNADIVDANIGCGTRCYGGNATMLVFFASQRNDRVRLKRVNNAGERLPRLRDSRPDLEQNQVNHRGGIYRQAQAGAARQHGAARKGFQFAEIVGGKFAAAQVKNRVSRHQ